MYGALKEVTDYIPIICGTKMDTQEYKQFSSQDSKEKRGSPLGRSLNESPQQGA
jgi:hypothetical protein